MAVDDRLRERLQRSMSSIDVDTEPRLRDARRRGRRRIVIRRTLAATVVGATIVVAVVMAPRVLDLTTGRGSKPATTPSPFNGASPPLILGTWRSVYTCEGFVQGFRRAGIGDLAARWLVNDGLQQRSVQPGDSSGLCDGAGQFVRTHTFAPNGMILTLQGQRVADHCRCFELRRHHTYIVLGRVGQPIATLRYTFDGDTLRFDAVMPDRCNAMCMEHFAWAVGNYAVTTWQRVS